MERAELIEAVRKVLTEHRFRHTLGVAETAKRLAARYGADVEKAEIAGILHDYAKFWPASKMREVILQEPDLPDDLLDYDQELWHAPVGSVAIRRELGIADPEIVDAVRYHTSGRVAMSPLEKVVCLADYIEPNRNFPGVDEIRALAEEDLDRALATAFGGTIQFLIRHRKRVYPLTLLAYNDLLHHVEAKEAR
ncbi:MAG: phosphohydrolase [Bacillus thermozeamaize]|jgi:predicted HD superfamily hydrolase involved in NAD metabolism|uniref:bis(5'-nucleosyl)-tetraphosphatase (symmetrical) n=1 Tax=Bacillus thermozeamaize TaxID=230954 RepID=A0A1Y3PUZ8_9BACI|nr:MAG: phosphohydrolase [Bacillus thermozeamaize]